MTDIPPPDPAGGPTSPPPPSAPAPPARPTAAVPTQSAVSLAEPQRQSLIAIVFLVLRFIRSIGIVQIVVGAGFVLSQSRSVFTVALILIVILVVMLGLGAISWWRYTFQVAGGELRVKKGVVSQQALTVPLDRVQSVSIEQKFLHRIVGLVQVSLDTAGSSAAEFTIDAVDQDVAHALQAAAADHKPNSTSVDSPASPDEVHAASAHGAAAAPAEDVRERIVVQLSPGRLVNVALTRAPFSGLAVLAPLFAFGGDLVERIPFDAPDVDPENASQLLWFIPAAILLILVVSILLNIVQTVLRDWNLRVTRTAAGVRRDAGLLSTTSIASSLPRVQRIETSQGALERIFDLRSMTLHNIGEADIGVPGCTEQEAQDLRQLGLDGGNGVDLFDRRVSPLQVFKDTRNAGVFFGLLALGLFFVVDWWSLLLLLLVPLTWARSRRQTRLYRWGIDADSLGTRSEFVGWTKNEILLRKVNGVQVRQSLFERKRDLATVSVQLAGGVLSGGEVSIGMIPIGEAQAVRDRILFVAETDTRAFM